MTIACLLAVCALVLQGRRAHAAAVASADERVRALAGVDPWREPLPRLSVTGRLRGWSLSLRSGGREEQLSAGAAELVMALALAARAGAAPLPALRALCDDVDPDFAGAAGALAAALDTGLEAPAALRSAGVHLLDQLAACWQVAAESGAGMAATLDRLLVAERARVLARHELDAALAGPRATARLLAVLPVVGVVVGGSSSARFLLGSPLGVGCLAVGAGLQVLGWWLTRRVLRAAATP